MPHDADAVRPPPAKLRLGDAEYELVVTRRTGVAVYSGIRGYLRIGPGIEAELANHRLMQGHGFPVPRILADGEHQGLPYMLEESFGAVTLGDRFDDERDRTGSISEEALSTYLAVLERYARAQAALASRGGISAGDFRRLVGPDAAARLLPDLGTEILERFDRATATLADVPLSLVHADLHGHNMCKRGVIDLEEVGWAPAGYDVATATFVSALCNGDLGEGPADQAFSGSQIDQASRLVDDIFSGAGLARPSEHIEEFLLCRSIALCAKRHPDDELWAARQHVLRFVLATAGRGDRVAPMLRGR
ncbi:aminoglycoside phosphotransferase family protein [Actinopolymorpha sp. NPDC004070]|uniref:aminoglycoside phosphotransferase family protein n=1 Tax=Actinopolymorpha sp. NPDC004070 TaxID=3154548 RepID=UPI00339DB1CB